MPIRSSTKAARFAANAAEKAITGLGRWATTDHTGTAKLLANLPPMSWMDTFCIALAYILCSILGSVVSAAMVYVLIAYGIPMLLGV